MRFASLALLLIACRIADQHFIASDAGPPADHPPPGLAVPRLIAPASLSTATQQRPTLRWTLSAGDGIPAVELCRDRACTMPLGVGLDMASDQHTARPTAALPAGWVYWRVRVQRGTDEATSATWQFWVGTASASTDVDTSHGAVLDVNGDGYADVVVGSYAASAGGAVHVYLGSSTASAADWNGALSTQRLDLVSPDGIGGAYGYRVASAGDVDGDGYGDFLVGAPFVAQGGRVHLYLGSASPRAIDWSAASSPVRVDITTPDEVDSYFGSSAAAAGDVNGDGYGDFVVGAYAAASFKGAAHVYLGGPAPGPAQWNGATAAARIDLAAPEGEVDFGNVAGAGDVNGDQYADFIVGAPNAGPGITHLYLGASDATATAWNGPAATRRIDLTAPSGAGTHFGGSVASAGDVNGDGYADLLVAADSTASGTGAAYLYLGSASPGTATQRIDLVSPDGANGFFGNVSSVGDVNGDGYADFAVGAGGDTSKAGAAHVYLGAAQPGAAAWNGSAAASRIDLASPNAAGGGFGLSVAALGDVNGDGYADFVVGAPSAASGAGTAHLYAGTTLAGAASWNGSAPRKRVDLVCPDDGSAQFGVSVAMAGLAGWTAW